MKRPFYHFWIVNSKITNDGMFLTKRKLTKLTYLSFQWRRCGFHTVSKSTTRFVLNLTCGDVIRTWKGTYYNTMDSETMWNQNLIQVGRFSNSQRGVSLCSVFLSRVVDFFRVNLYFITIVLLVFFPVKMNSSHAKGKYLEVVVYQLLYHANNLIFCIFIGLERVTWYVLVLLDGGRVIVHRLPCDSASFAVW